MEHSFAIFLLALSLSMLVSPLTAAAVASDIIAEDVALNSAVLGPDLSKADVDQTAVESGNGAVADAPVEGGVETAAGGEAQGVRVVLEENEAVQTDAEAEQLAAMMETGPETSAVDPEKGTLKGQEKVAQSAALQVAAQVSEHEAHVEPKGKVTPSTEDQGQVQQHDFNHLEVLLQELNQEVERFKEITDGDGEQAQNLSLRRLVSAAIRAIASTSTVTTLEATSTTEAHLTTSRTNHPTRRNTNAPTAALPTGGATTKKTTTTSAPTAGTSMQPVPGNDQLVNILHRLTSDVIAFRQAVHDILMEVFNVAQDIGMS